MQNTILPSQRTVEFGIYRDGDNNLDASQELAPAQALDVSANDPRVAFTVEDTTALRGSGHGVAEADLHTNQYQIEDGHITRASVDGPHDMASEANLAAFVDRTLDNAQRDGVKQTWVELVDHGGGDGGGLETHDGRVMSMPDMAKAIADGEALHAKEHPEDARRTVDGVVANQCLMSTLGFADTLSGVGVKYLAASPETMISPGVPSTVAHDIASHSGDAHGMATSMVSDVMRSGSAAAFDVLDLAPDKIGAMRCDVKALNDAIAATKDPAQRTALRDDVDSVDGMVRFPESKGLPWHADRPAIAAYGAIAKDARLSGNLRNTARTASHSVSDLVIAHKESASFGPFDGSNYRDAVGPTVHLPTNKKQIDPWASHGVSETDNDFYKETDGAGAASTLA
jgi:hypothetical protein